MLRGSSFAKAALSGRRANIYIRALEPGEILDSFALALDDLI
jgi:hypothetical protein